MKQIESEKKFFFFFSLQIGAINDDFISALLKRK